VFCEAEIRDGERLIAKASGTFKYLKSPILRRSYAECAGKYRLGYFLTEEDEYLSPNCTGGAAARGDYQPVLQTGTLPVLI
jgi:hypothetical protein